MNSPPISQEQSEKYINKVLLRQTQNLPCKIIEINGAPYLERYFLGHNANGFQLWLHHFLTADGERHHHSHPWFAISQILCGGYCEETLKMFSQQEFPEFLNNLERYQTGHFAHCTEAKIHDGTVKIKRQRWYFCGHTNLISPGTLHRITEVKPNTWTSLTVTKERAESWFFIDDNGNRQTMAASPSEWWQNCKTRDGGDYDRNALALA